MSELKPCPFCGGEANLSIDPEAKNDTMGRCWAYTVVCAKCAASTGLGWSVKMVSELWNRRTESEGKT